MLMINETCFGLFKAYFCMFIALLRFLGPSSGLLRSIFLHLLSDMKRKRKNKTILQNAQPWGKFMLLAQNNGGMEFAFLREKMGPICST